MVRHLPAYFPANPAVRLTSRSGEGWTALILGPPCRAHTLDDLLQAVGDLRPDRALEYFAQLVKVVEYLHSNNVVHRAIRPKLVFVEGGKAAGGDDPVGLRLVGAGWYRRLIDLNKAEPWLQQPSREELPEAWCVGTVCPQFPATLAHSLACRMSPEAIAAPFTYDKARDMFELGVLFAQMLFGTSVTETFASPTDLVNSCTLFVAVSPVHVGHLSAPLADDTSDCVQCLAHRPLLFDEHSATSSSLKGRSVQQPVALRFSFPRTARVLRCTRR